MDNKHISPKLATQNTDKITIFLLFGELKHLLMTKRQASSPSMKVMLVGILYDSGLVVGNATLN